MEIHFLWIPAGILMIMSIGYYIDCDGVNGSIFGTIAFIYCFILSLYLVYHPIPQDPHEKKMQKLEYEDRLLEVLHHAEHELVLEKLQSEFDHLEIQADSANYLKK